MPAFLLTWSPLRYDSAGGGWPTPGAARGKQIRKGDRLFMLRQGREPRGIFGSGWATTD
jgi:hypothetical protein